MPTTVQFRRGTTAQNNAFTGAAGEITYDTEKATLRVHDAATAGGSTLLSSLGATQSIESSTTATPDFTFKNTTDDATGPVLRLESDRATPGDNDVAGTIEFKASDDAGAQVLTANIVSKITDVSNGSEDGNLEFTVHAAGSSTKIATIDATGVTINSGILVATTGSTVGNLTLANGSITDSSGAISFGDENLTTTGTATAGTITIGSGSITDTSGAISFGNENLTTTGTITGGIGVFDNIRIDAIAGEIDTSSDNLVIDSAGGTVTVDDNLTVTGNLQLDGNLTVSGTTTSVNTTNIEVQDALLELSKNNSGGTDVDSGIIITRGSAGNNAAWYWNEGDDRWKAVLTTSEGTATTVTDSSYATVNVGGLVFGAESVIPTSVKDEDNMASDSATALATQQSIKAYVDNSIGAISSTAISEGNSNVTVADSGVGSVTVTIDGATHTTFNSSGITLATGNFIGTATSAQYADLAEMYSADAEYEPGTVMSFGGDQEITQSTQSHDVKVAGVVSTAPAYLMNADLENGTALALQGRTPVKVIGRIHKGDMLVASQTPGVACALDSSFYAPGCVIGKALESYDSQSVGTIEVVVGRI